MGVASDRLLDRAHPPDGQGPEGPIRLVLHLKTEEPLLIAETLQQAADDQQIDQQARSRFQGAGLPLKNQGKRDVTIRTPRGSLTIRVTYYSRNCDRSQEQKGLYPVLLVWGVHDGCTLGLASEVSKLDLERLILRASLSRAVNLIELRAYIAKKLLLTATQFP